MPGLPQMLCVTAYGADHGPLTRQGLTPEQFVMYEDPLAVFDTRAAVNNGLVDKQQLVDYLAGPRSALPHGDAQGSYIHACIHTYIHTYIHT